MNEFIIIGDTDNTKDCLVCLCGKSFEGAKEILNRMLNNPTENDKKLMGTLYNFRIDKVVSEYCWWNYGCD